MPFSKLRNIIFLLIVMSFLSCGKENEKKNKTEIQNNVSSEEDEDDTPMSPEEVFSSTLTQGMAGDDEIQDLQLYLEEQIYPSVSKSEKVTLDRISVSLYLLSYNESGVQKNFTLQKFYNPAKDEVFFERKEIQSDAVKQFLK
ncbi:MAG: hypothetical protein JNJ56_05335 [Ignavibacteria bacterium]|nr:hypothetical protein [Ignavibacteria bacterium]